jgi:hypothetical protein
MDRRQAIEFVREHGVVLQAARGPVPSLAAAVAGEEIRGSWWGHAKAHQIFHAARAVCDSADVLVCKLIDGKITYVHRRLWPAFVKLSSRFTAEQLTRVSDEHTESGAHRSVREPFPEWVPADVVAMSKRMSVGDAEDALRPWLRFASTRTTQRTRR